MQGARLVAGVASVPLDATPGLAMMGYALRTGAAQGTLDPLSARGLYVRGAQDFLVVALDLCLVAVSQAAEIRDRLAVRTGVGRDRITVTCIHTHSGPDTGFAAILAGAPVAPPVARLLDAAVEAGARAFDAATPARAGFATAPLAIGRSRRRAGADADRRVRVVRIDRDDGSPLAIVWHHGCHPTALGHENLLFSADWPGAARSRIEAEFPGALSIFLLSAHADVDPRTRGLQDLALVNRSVGVGVAAMRELGDEAGDAVVRAASRAETHSEVAVGVGATRVRVPVHGGDDPDAAATALARRRGEAFDAIGLDPGARVRNADLFRLAEARAAALGPAAAREISSKLRLYLRDRSASQIVGAREAEFDLQVLSFGEARWLAVPFEPTLRVGRAFEGAGAGEHRAVLSIANGWLRYLPHPIDFADPPGGYGYEVLNSTLLPRGATHILETALEIERDIDFHFRSW
ncbi:hypothetical protein MYXO_01496 [Myxococcaceae bacterium]|nr:hypothetical protein MYXO_01496 [Myxococcaceae bacterium]